MSGKDKEELNEAQFDWIQLRREIRENVSTETTEEKFIRKFKENPFVPIGCLATFGALSYGLWSFRQGRRQMSQYMMRLRIAAQGFTVVALIVGIGMSALRT
ncbi:hypothetical protein L9F63_023834 [Diploptera punctata]|uniref:HIG1 domain-containing protein n=1 Tax=Diploptera punctata TaxID=6984 RepID=A0AAD7ZHW8_DIPPU|nr:hypothetical protein L9F63_023834 [Diploptera punctata]